MIDAPEGISGFAHGDPMLGSDTAADSARKRQSLHDYLVRIQGPGEMGPSPPCGC
jgi:hypothetical protein